MSVLPVYGVERTSMYVGGTAQAIFMTRLDRSPDGLKGPALPGAADDLHLLLGEVGDTGVVRVQAQAWFMD